MPQSLFLLQDAVFHSDGFQLISKAVLIQAHHPWNHLYHDPLVSVCCFSGISDITPNHQAGKKGKTNKQTVITINPAVYLKSIESKRTTYM